MSQLYYQDMWIIDPELYQHSGKVNEVASTRILVSPEKGHESSRQLTVYSNRVSLGQGTSAVAMILPVPNPGNDPQNICVLDTSDDKGTKSRLFDLLFPITRMVEKTAISKNSRSMLQSANIIPAGKQMLPVEKSGSYAYTVVPKITDFDRVQGAVLPNRPSENVMDLLRQSYDTDSFSFLVCKLCAAEDAQYHPLAYTHPLLRTNVQSGNVKRIFVPTLHFHGDEHEVNESDSEKETDSLGNVLSPFYPGDPQANAHDAYIRTLLKQQRRQMKKEQTGQDTESKKHMHALQYHGITRYDVDQDENADFFRRESPEFPHWDHEIYMFGVAADEPFGRRASVMQGTQEQLDSALYKIPSSYSRALSSKQDMSNFRFRRMLGKRFANEDITLLPAPPPPRPHIHSIFQIPIPRRFIRPPQQKKENKETT